MSGTRPRDDRDTKPRIKKTSVEKIRINGKENEK